MSCAHDSCSVCDGRIDAYGRDDTRCARCDAPCPVCGEDVSLCRHPLADLDRSNLEVLAEEALAEVRLQDQVDRDLRRTIEINDRRAA